MHQRNALGRALSRAVRRPARDALPPSRLRLRTHRMLFGMSGGVRLLYLTASRTSAAMRIDNRLTVRLLMAEARAARATSLHAYLVCMITAREFVASRGHHAERRIVARGVHGSRTARSLATGDGILHLLRAPDQGQSALVRGNQRHDVLHTLALSQVLTGTQRFVRELKDRQVPSVDGRRASSRRDAPGLRGGPKTPMRSAIDASTAAQRIVAARRHTSRPIDDLSKNIPTGRPGSTAPSHRPTTRPWMRLRDRHAPSLRGKGATPRTTAARQASANALPRMTYFLALARHRTVAMSAATGPRPGTPDTPRERAAARLSAFHPIDTAITQAATSPSMPRSYASTPSTTLTFRRTPRAALPDAKRQTSQLQQQVVRQVTQELAQNAPWRGQLEQAVLAPRVLRELTDRVAGAIAGRQGLERYRRGL